MVRPDGPLICKGDKDVILLNANEQMILQDKEFALCRCGFSKNKPFCDGSHKKEAEPMAQTFTDKREQNIEAIEGELTITVKENAMYSISGPVTIFSRNGESKTTRLKVALCRCGHSDNKPFCDAKHKKCGFTA